ncbi:glycoside hydrolase family 2 [Catenulispora sp. NL8]|uniref:Glycoside hydrolase family 2 n=1 Tax=Catenulispora pinistramenti TaxID=2705254 RepID=A0ABS5KN49_9ACTN|nr:sugar-binding domain-containing protein [Catenulispora pinistramenti]MBS2547482.1 glycoside hydrolase family 2 [Catenulispora pinistramenti]
MSTVRPEYPRPHFDRSHAWLNLNGTWDFSRDPDGWGEQIVVPFAWETEAAGPEAHWLEWGWYRRQLAAPADWSGQRIVLHFGAVHHFATVWVNGTLVGEHEGGYTPFELDVTDALDGQGGGTLVVRVHAPLDKREIVHGKQRSIPRDVYDVCAFTPSSGIWQPVWLEARPATYLADVALRAGAELDAIEATVSIGGSAGSAGSGSASGSGVRLTATVAGEQPVTVEVADPSQPVSFRLPIAEPRLWSPADPHLYPVTVTLESADGTDRVAATTGLRRVETDGDRILLNGERLYVRGVLDQGYWPRTGITAPEDQAFVTDLEAARAAGFNLVRKHLKLEDPRFLHHADRLGMLVWAEPASTGVFTDEAVARFEAQIEPMVRRDGNHPSIVIWGLYNEEWGLDWDVAADPRKQEATRHAYDLLKALDPTRPAVDDSGWSHVATDLLDWHVYDEYPDGWAAKVRALLADGEPGFPVGIGPGTVVEKVLMADGRPVPRVPNLNSEFGGGLTSVERGWNLRWQTLELRRYDALSGYVWTELYDIEHETAGIYAFDRGAKDDGGNPPDLTNAVTVAIPDVVPLAPGCDLVAAEGGGVEFDVRISHHGPAAVEVTVVPVWGAALQPYDFTRVPDSGSGQSVKVQPFRLSEAVRIRELMPSAAAETEGARPKADVARLHLVLVSAGGVVGHTCVDVATRPVGRTAIDGSPTVPRQ